jgi:hypothetical protein
MVIQNSTSKAPIGSQPPLFVVENGDLNNQNGDFMEFIADL